MKFLLSAKLRETSTLLQSEKKVSTRSRNMKNKRRLKKLISRSKLQVLQTKLLKKVQKLFHPKKNITSLRRPLRMLERSPRTNSAGKVQSLLSRTPRTSRTACVL